MKVFCSLLVILIACQVVLGIAPRYVQRDNGRTTFNRRHRLHDSFIVGGDPAFIEDFPHHLGLLDLSWGGYICGASVIHRLWSLSAAHCLEFGVPPNQINLWGGSTSRLSGGTVFFVQTYILHPQYDWRNLDNDIAVLRVEDGSPLEGVPHVRPIPLSPNCAGACCDVCIAGSNIIVAGWGVYDNDSGRIPENLLQVDKALFDHAECDRVWGGITSRMFCTVAENGRDSCQGDSGGAIIRDGVQVGVVSFGSEVCGDGSAPAVYVRVEDPLVRNFIRQHSGV